MYKYILLLILFFPLHSCSSTAGPEESSEETSELPFQSVKHSPDGIGIVDITSFTFETIRNYPSLTYTWDFGDGTTSTGAEVTHVFAAEGDFEVTMTVSNSTESETYSTMVQIGSLNGTYTRMAVEGVEHTLVIEQVGDNLTGDWIVSFAPGSPHGSPDEVVESPLSGTLAHPRQLTLVQEGGCQRTITDGEVNSDLTVIGGSGIYGNTNCGGDVSSPSWFFDRSE